MGGEIEHAARFNDSFRESASNIPYFLLHTPSITDSPTMGNTNPIHTVVFVAGIETLPHGRFDGILREFHVGL